MSFKKKTLFASIVMLSFLSSGCSMLGEKEDSEFKKGLDSESKNANNKVERYLDSQKEDMELKKKVDLKKNFKKEKDAPILSIKKLPKKHSLPSLFYKNIVMVEPFPVSLEDLTTKVSEVTNVPIDVEDDVLSSTGGEMAEMDAGGGSLITINHDGKLEVLLDRLASKVSAYWRYDQKEEKIVFYKYVTKHFYIPSIPGNYQIAASVQGSNQNNSASFNTSQSNWQSIRQDVETMLSPSGTFTLSESSGIMTVKDIPVNMDRIEKYVDLVKKGMRSQVLIDVQIYSVRTESEESTSFNLGAALESSDVGLSISGATTSSITGPASFIMGLSNDVTSGNVTLPADRNQLLFEILKEMGTTSMVASNTIRTVNNQPSALTTTDIESYLEKKELTVDSNSGTTQTELSVNEKTTGLSLHVLPTLDENGKDMLLQMSFTLSKINGYNEFSSDGNVVRSPIINSRDFVEKVWLRSGQSLVLTGFDKTDIEKKDGSSAFFSSQDINKKTNEKLVIVVTPAVYNAVTKNNLDQ